MYQPHQLLYRYADYHFFKSLYIVIHRQTILFSAVSTKKLFENNEQICTHFRRAQPCLINFSLLILYGVFLTLCFKLRDALHMNIYNVYNLSSKNYP